MATATLGLKHLPNSTAVEDPFVPGTLGNDGAVALCPTGRGAPEFAAMVCLQPPITRGPRVRVPDRIRLQSVLNFKVTVRRRRLTFGLARVARKPSLNEEVLTGLTRRRQIACEAGDDVFRRRDTGCGRFGSRRTAYTLVIFEWRLVGAHGYSRSLLPVSNAPCSVRRTVPSQDDAKSFSWVNTFTSNFRFGRAIGSSDRLDCSAAVSRPPLLLGCQAKSRALLCGSSSGRSSAPSMIMYAGESRKDRTV